MNFLPIILGNFNYKYMYIFNTDDLRKKDHAETKKIRNFQHSNTRLYN